MEYVTRVRISLLEDWTAKAAEMSPRDLGVHWYKIEADTAAGAEERALDLVGETIAIGLPEGVDVDVECVTSKEFIAGRLGSPGAFDHIHFREDPDR